MTKVMDEASLDAQARLTTEASTCTKQKKISQKALQTSSFKCQKSKRCKDTQITENIQEQRI